MFSRWHANYQDMINPRRPRGRPVGSGKNDGHPPQTGLRRKSFFFFFLLSPHFNFLDSARAETIATQATLKRTLSAYPKERTDFSEKYKTTIKNIHTL